MFSYTKQLKRMRLQFNLSLIVILFLTACSTIPNLSYYMLPDVNIDSSPHPIKVVHIELSEYIDHRDVVLKLDTGSFHRANFHMWSESLEDGIARLLEKSTIQETPVRIELVVTQFHGTESGYVTFSGAWRESNADNEGAAWNAFEYQSPVSKSGYVNMIEAQAQLVDALRQEISKSVSN